MAYKTKIGLMGTGLDAYWPQFDGLKERLLNHLTSVETSLEEFGECEVISAGLVTTNTTKRKIILIVDNLRVHLSKVVREWLAARKDRIEMVYPPSYSPELNSDEYLNKFLKQTVTKEDPPADKESLDDLPRRPRRSHLFFLPSSQRHL